MKGIYADSVTNLSARSVLKQFFEVEQRYGSIINGLWQTRNNKQQDDSIHFLFNDLNLNDYSTILNQYSIYYLHDGMETLIQTLVKYLQTLSNIELMNNQSIRKIYFFRKFNQ